MSDINSNSHEQAETSGFALMNQLPGPHVAGQSPLHHVDLENLAQIGAKKGGIEFQERKLLGYLTLRCDASNNEQRAAVEQVFGVALPVEPLSSVEQGDCTMRWISPDEWLITVPGEQAFGFESNLRACMPGHYSIVNGSGGMTVVNLSGADVVELLKKCVPVDLHETAFPVGKVISTVFAKSAAILRRTGASQFELVFRRSFADYIWLWIQDASREFGLVIKA